MTDLSTVEVDRFFAKTLEDPDSECLFWAGARSPSGYGNFTSGGVTIYAHRFAYLIAHGTIPNGLEIDHLCRCRWCVNPDHLEAVTRRRNVLRSSVFAAVQARRTHCPAGHEYTNENTYWYKNKRDCRICRRERSKRCRR